MKVECYDETGAEVYDMVVRQIIPGSPDYLSGEGFTVYVDPREPLFIIVVS